MRSDEDKQDFINESVLEGIREIKALLSPLSEKVAAHEEKFSSHEELIKAAHTKTWDLTKMIDNQNAKLFWTIISVSGALGLVVVSFIIGVVKYNH